MKALNILFSSLPTIAGELKERLTTRLAGIGRRKKTKAILDLDFKLRLQRLIDEKLKRKEVTN